MPYIVELRLADAAQRNGDWALAAALTYRGDGVLVGIPEPVKLDEEWRRAPPLSNGERGGDQPQLGSPFATSQEA